MSIHHLCTAFTNGKLRSTQDSLEQVMCFRRVQLEIREEAVNKPELSSWRGGGKASLHPRFQTAPLPYKIRMCL